jgi:LPXTG-motif cell wall-anchored protein
MSFAPRRRAPRALAALVALVALMLPLAVAGTALAQSTSTITQQDCEQGTIRDKSGEPISQERCEQLVGKQVELASTGFEVWPLLVGGLAFVAGAAWLGLRRRGAVHPA